MHGWTGNGERGARCRLAPPCMDSDRTSDALSPLSRGFRLRVRLFDYQILD